MGRRRAPVLLYDVVNGQAVTDPCPYCRRQHYHGDGDGHRVAHCGGRFDPDALGYVLRRRERAQ